jgi:hypothetical protein
VKLKTIYFILGLIFLIILGYVVSMPEFVPSLKFIQQIIICVIFVLIIGLAYILIVLFQNYLKEKQIPRTGLLSRLFAFIIISCLIIIFVLVSKNIGGFNKKNLFKELDFPTQKVKLYLYDYSDKQPMTSVKVKIKDLPFLHNVAYIENQRPGDLKAWRHNDTVFFTGNNIELIYDLKKRKAKKIYLKKE